MNSLLLLRFIKMIRNILSYLLFVCCFFAFYSCSSKKNNPTKPVQLNSVETEALKGTASELLDKGKDFYSSKLFSLARENFHSLLLRYPNSAYAEFAELKKADSVFFSGQFQEAASLYSIFYEGRTVSTNRDYALFAMGRSFELSYSGAGRDLNPLLKAKASYERLIKNYPNSLFFDSTKRYLKDVIVKIDLSKVNIINYYDEMGNKKAMEARKNELEGRE